MTTTMAPPVWAELVDELATEGVLDQSWRAAFLAVPREVFIPEVIWRPVGDGPLPLRRDDEPAEWLARAYGSHYVITQVDDGAQPGPRAGAGGDQLGVAAGHRGGDTGRWARRAGDAGIGDWRPGWGAV